MQLVEMKQFQATVQHARGYTPSDELNLKDDFLDNGDGANKTPSDASMERFRRDLSRSRPFRCVCPPGFGGESALKTRPGGVCFLRATRGSSCLTPLTP